MRIAFDRRRTLMVDLLNAIPRVSSPLPEGAFYAYPSVAGLMNKSIGGTIAQSSAELAAIILEKAEVAVVPGEAFGTPGFFRLSYATSDENITEGLARMHALLASATD
jgi:aspartate/methionine/tyrosine aminotransferase